jgi:sugar O-acyltransferase (sialic acid O-acetyltransferase NeuD family)
MGRWTRISLFDDKSGPGRTFEDLLSQDPADLAVFVAIGSNAVREKLQSRLATAGFSMPVIRHPAAIVAEDVEIGAGSLLAAGAIVGTGSRLAAGCIVNTAASVDHDCRLAGFVHIAPGARLAGTVSVGRRTLIGLGAVVIENLSVGDDVIVGAGAVVIGAVADRKTVMGVPAR